MHNIWMWLLIGFFPHSIKRQHCKDTQLLAVHALFWHLAIQWHNGRSSWSISILFLKQFRQ
jgi:hypothetical protein